MPVLLASKPGLLLLPSLALHHLTRSCRITVAFASSSPQGIANTHRHPSHTPVRPLASTVTTKMAGSEQPRFSAGSDVTAMESALAPLLTANGGRWTLAGAGEALEREFKFKTFAKTWDFMTAVALQCKIKGHHPEWSNVFNTTFIRWTTHNPKGLSAKDAELAAICDSLARDFGEVVEPKPRQQEGEEKDETQQRRQPGQDEKNQQQTTACQLSGLADRAAGSAGECCAPRRR